MSTWYEPHQIFKIRRRSDGLFSTGGSSPRFRKEGKTWTKRHHVTAHLRLLGDRERKLYQDCDLVTYTCTVTEVADLLEDA